MMIECPRCRFAQPKDQYCASCGLNIDQFLARPKSFRARILQNPNLHLMLIGTLIVFLVGWIFYTQRALVSREVGILLDRPVSSRDAGDPNELRNPEQAQASTLAAKEVSETELPVVAAAATVAQDSTEPKSVPDDAPDSGAVKTKLEVSFWEIPRETIAPLLSAGEKNGEGNGGRGFYFAQPAKLLEALIAQGQTAGASRSSGLTVGAEILVETPASSNDGLQYLFQVEVTKAEGRDLTLRWESNLILPQGEPPISGPPALTVTTLSGLMTLASPGAFLLVVDPSNRVPPESFINKAGEGPWSILSSAEYRAGLTDWLILVQLK